MDACVPSGCRKSEVRTPGSPAPATRSRAPSYADWACLRLEKSVGRRGDSGSQDSLERWDLGVKTAAFAALGEMAALREEGVTDPLVVACKGVKEGESTLNLFFAFSFWFNLEWSWMYGQAGQSHDSVQRVRRPALTVLVPAVSVDGDVAAKGVLGFWARVRCGACSYATGTIPRPFGRGEDTPRRESAEGPPKAVAIKRACAGCVMGVPLGEWAALAAVCRVLDWAAASLHLAAALFDLVRL